MTGIYTRQLGHVVLLSTAGVELLKAPATGTLVVRDLLITNGTSSAVQTVNLSLYPGDGSAAGAWLLLSNVAPGTLHIDLRQALNPNDRIIASATQTPVAIFATGYLFV